MMQVNLNSVVVLTEIFLPGLISAQDKIINTALTAAFQPGLNSFYPRQDKLDHGAKCTLYFP